jgi:glutaredoxin 3
MPKEEPSKPVVIFTQPRCGNCARAKQFLAAHNIQYEERNVARDRQALRELVEMHGSQITPTILVGDNRLVGFNEKELARLLGLP